MKMGIWLGEADLCGSGPIYQLLIKRGERYSGITTAR